MKPQNKVNEIQMYLEKERIKVRNSIYASSKYEKKKKLDRLLDAITRSIDDLRRSQL